MEKGGVTVSHTSSQKQTVKIRGKTIMIDLVEKAKSHKGL